MPCPASTKLMRTSKSGEWNTDLTTTPVLLVPYDEHRVTLIISPPTSGVLRLGLRRNSSSTIGLTIPNLTPNLILTMGDHGDMVRGPIYAATSTGTQSITCWDTSLPSLE